jgi:hypothetical protein
MNPNPPWREGWTMNPMIKAATRRGRITPEMRARARAIAATWREIAEYEAQIAD